MADRICDKVRSPSRSASSMDSSGEKNTMAFVQTDALFTECALRARGCAIFAPAPELDAHALERLT
eukprot:1909042-Pyramimonas_sp.AAC.1